MSHFLNEVMQTFVVLFLGNGAMLQKAVERIFLLPEKPILLFLARHILPLLFCSYAQPS